MKYYLDCRQPSKSGKYPIKMVITHRGRPLLISVGISVRKEDWSPTGRISRKSLDNEVYNRKLIKWSGEVADLFFTLRDEEVLDTLEVSDLKNMIVERILKKQAVRRDSFKSVAMRLIDEAHAENTKKMYRSMLSCLSSFKNLDSLTFSNMTYQFFKDFERHLYDRGLTPNSINLRFTNIKAVFNRAINEGMTKLYPFKGIKTQYKQVVKRSLPVDVLRSILSFESSNPSVCVARDAFKLSFMLIGVNYADMQKGLKMNHGRVSYIRSKTGKRYDIKIEPEMKELISRYEENGMIVFHAHYKSMNENLKKIEDGLTIYYARHSWATIACSLGIPIETISLALGHEIGSPITNLYIDFDLRKVDEANRKVLDYVFNHH